MSQENVEVVQGALAAWNQGDRQAALAYVETVAEVRRCCGLSYDHPAVTVGRL